MNPALWIASFLLAVAACEAPADRAVIHVDSLGAVPDGETDSGPAIREAIYRAKSLGRPVNIKLSKGEYAIWPKNDTYDYQRFGMATGGEDRCCLVIDNAKDITFAGAGPETVLSIRNPQFGGIAAEFSTNIVLRDFAVDYDPLPFTQGRITSIDEEQGSFVLRLDPGFAEFDHPGFTDPDLCFGNTFDPTALQHRTGRPLFLESWDRLSDTEYRLHAAERTPIGTKQLKVGDRYFHCFIRFNRSPVEAWFVRGVVLKNITVYAGITIAYLIGHTEESTLIRNCNILPRPRTDRAINVNADGIHSFGVRGEFIIEGCDFRDNNDDSINVHNRGLNIKEVLSDREVVLYSEKFTIKAGDRLYFYDYATKLPIERLATATEVEELPGFMERTHYSVAFTPPIPGLEADSGKRVFNWDACGSGVVIRNNRLTNAGGIKLRCPNAVVENNRLSVAGGLVMFDIYYYNEGPIPHTMAVRNNDFGGAGIVVGDRWERAAGDRRVRDIEIVGNRLGEYRPQQITLWSCENVIIRDNVVTVSGEPAPGDMAEIVDMVDCENVAIEDWRVRRQRPK